MTDRRDVLLLAAYAGCDPSTAKKAIEGGVLAVRGWSLRHRLVDASRALAIQLGTLARPNVIRLVTKDAR